MKLNLAHGLTIQPSRINGRGCFAIIYFKRGKKIAEYAGERISDLEAQKRALKRRFLRICDIDGRSSIVSLSVSIRQYFRINRGVINAFEKIPSLASL